MDRAFIVVAFLLVTIGSPAPATDYHVGPGQPLATIGAVPWATLAPGDTVSIHWRDTPYREKWVINRRGTAAAWITVRGVPGPAGQRPVIDGSGAVTAPGLDFWNDQRGLIKIGGSSIPADGLPAYLVIEGLELRSARPPFQFTNDGGSTQTYADNAAAIYVEKAEHLIIRDCVLHDSGNGLFVGAFDGQTRDLVIEHSHLFDNGIVGSVFEHNAYTEAIDITYRYNRFGALRSGADGNNLKDRSAGLVVYGNWIEDGNRQLDLVDGGSAVAADPSYGQTFVHSNVLIESDGEGNSQIVHYGGDGGDTGRYRKGTLYFYNNTVVSTRSGNTTLVRLSTQDESAEVINNILYVTASGNRLAMVDSAGALRLRHNWTKAGWRSSHGSLTGSIDDNGSGVEGTTPGFVDEANQNYRPAAGTDGVDAGTLLPLATAGHPPTTHYVQHLGAEPRPSDLVLDLGAYEFCPSSCQALFFDGFEDGDTRAWSARLPP